MDPLFDTTVAQACATIDETNVASYRGAAQAPPSPLPTGATDDEANAPDLHPCLPSESQHATSSRALRSSPELRETTSTTQAGRVENIAGTTLVPQLSDVSPTRIEEPPLAEALLGFPLDSASLRWLNHVGYDGQGSPGKRFESEANQCTFVDYFGVL